jgi:hypothetical protein
LFVGLIYARNVPIPPRVVQAVLPLVPISIALTTVYIFYTQFSLTHRFIPTWPEW